MLFKDSANRVEKKQACLIFYSEVPPILCKDSANRVEKKQACLNFLSRGAAYVMQR